MYIFGIFVYLLYLHVHACSYGADCMGNIQTDKIQLSTKNLIPSLMRNLTTACVAIFNITSPRACRATVAAMALACFLLGLAVWGW